MSPQLLMGGVGALLLIGLLLSGLRAGWKLRRHAQSLRRQRGPGSLDAFRLRAHCHHLSEERVAKLYSILASHSAPGFEIALEDTLEREFGVGTRWGVPLSEFLDDARALLDLPRPGTSAAEPVTVADLVAVLDGEAGPAPIAEIPSGSPLDGM